MFQTILAALDETALSDQVIKVIQQLKPQTDHRVILVRVIGPSEFDSQRPADQPSVDPTLGLYRYVEQRLQAHQAQLTCPSELEVVAGDLPKRLCALPISTKPT